MRPYPATLSTGKPAPRKSETTSCASASTAVCCCGISRYRTMLPSRAPATPGNASTTRERPRTVNSSWEPWAWLARNTILGIAVACARSGRTLSICSRRTVTRHISAAKPVGNLSRNRKLLRPCLEGRYILDHCAPGVELLGPLRSGDQRNLVTGHGESNREDGTLHARAQNDDFQSSRTNLSSA